MPGMPIMDPDEHNACAAEGEKVDVIQELSRKCIDELEGRVCYFSLSGNLALATYKDTALKVVKRNKDQKLRQDVLERLYFAVLMFDKVVMHCSDPLRSSMILDILIEHSEWIKEGNIVFLFSDTIEDIRKDYRDYINRKINDYSDGYFCQIERESLEQEYMSDEYYNKVINILNYTHCLVQKSTEPGYSFANLVQKDLQKAEQVIIDTGPSERVVLERMNLSLHQLLKMKYCGRNGKIGSVFPEELADEVIDDVTEHLENGSMVARSAIVESMRRKLAKKPNRQQEHVLRDIMLRMDILYCRMNSGNRLILEFHPSYVSTSMYQLRCFEIYLQKICGCKKRVGLSYDLVREILKSDADELLRFRGLYLASAADALERIKLEQVKEMGRMEALFSLALEDNQVVQCADRQFSSIKSIIKKGAAK